MSDADALLSAIIAHPDEDTPRLVFADWLDEHDQPERAEFIRIQIERASLDPQSERHRTCADREAELLTHNRRAWERPFREAVPGGVFGFRRGFVALVGMEDRFYQQSFARLLRMTPLEEVRLPAGSPTSKPGMNHPPHVRFRVVVKDYPRPKDVFVHDVLRPKPTELEPFLRRGAWVVQAAGITEPWHTPPFPAHAVCEAFLRQRRYRLAVRPFYHPAEFAGWGRKVPEDRRIHYGGNLYLYPSHWYVLEDGEEVEHYTSRSGEPGESILNRMAREADR